MKCTQKNSSLDREIAVPACQGHSSALMSFRTAPTSLSLHIVTTYASNNGRVASCVGRSGLVNYDAQSRGRNGRRPSCTKLITESIPKTIPPRHRHHTDWEAYNSNPRRQIFTWRTYRDCIWSHRVSWSVYRQSARSTRMSSGSTISRRDGQASFEANRRLGEGHIHGM